MSNIILQIDQLSKTFPDTPIAAVHNISLQIFQGEVVALTGPSGAGKTTLLRLLAGLLLPDTGTIYLQKELVNTYAEELVAGHPDIHMVFQDFKLFPNHTVQENINYLLRYYDKDFQQAKTQELLQLFHLEVFATKYPRELSGGQQQRVALAKAMAAEPTVLLLDEPFSQIDGRLKQEIKQALRHLVNEYDTTLLFVTHDTSDALSFADRIALIHQGDLIQFASPTQVYQKPTNQFVASYFGWCNFLPLAYIPTRFQTNGHADQMACIRPEQFSLVMQSKADFKGKVVQQHFMGSHYILDVSTTSSQTLQVFAHQAYQIGQAVYLRIEDLHWVSKSDKLLPYERK
ncbi:MAG TPA: ABC transporter ATP-binding protein [Microscillaceae bacterium]|nr:ABC transporter ATP-binding protein [Microscillaceae bacterium]